MSFRVTLSRASSRLVFESASHHHTTHVIIIIHRRGIITVSHQLAMRHQLPAAILNAASCAVYTFIHIDSYIIQRICSTEPSVFKPASNRAPSRMYSRPPLDASGQDQQPHQEPNRSPWDNGGRAEFVPAHQQQSHALPPQASWSAGGDRVGVPAQFNRAPRPQAYAAQLHACGRFNLHLLFNFRCNLCGKPGHLQAQVCASSHFS
jgi:hypothetical protein